MNKHVPKVGLVSFGCPKALVDSERIVTQLRAEGYVIAPGYDDADVVIVNNLRLPRQRQGRIAGRQSARP